MSTCHAIEVVVTGQSSAIDEMFTGRETLWLMADLAARRRTPERRVNQVGDVAVRNRTPATP